MQAYTANIVNLYDQYIACYRQKISDISCIRAMIAHNIWFWTEKDFTINVIQVLLAYI